MGKLFLISGDIIENSKGMNAIVNPQNKYMINGSGVCGVIYRNAGQELLNFCKNTYNKNMEVSEVRITPGFNLNMDIIHIYAPIFKEWDNPLDKLKESYINMLNSIKEKNYKNVIMPSIATGAHGYSHSDVASLVVEQLYYFCKNSETNIYLVNRYSIQTNEYFERLLELDDFSEKEIRELLLNTEECYRDFIEGRNLEEMNSYEKIVYSMENN